MITFAKHISQNIRLLLMAAMGIGAFFLASNALMLVDAIPTPQSWQTKAKQQAEASQDQQYKGCLFGDSISSGLGNSLGNGTFNFAMGGLSSVSLIEQLNLLKPSNFQCQQAIIAIGTNDAMNGTNNQSFLRNLEIIIDLLQIRHPQQITLIAAFYATDEASRNPRMAGTNERIQEINSLIRTIAQKNHLSFIQSELEPLFKQHTLRENLTYDGVHLNDDGKQIYRQVILNILKTSAGSAAYRGER